MGDILKYGIISFAFAFGLILITPDDVSAQNRRAQREYRREVRDARRDYREDLRDADNVRERREARREYRDEIRDARREYVRDARRDRNGWYFFRNGRRYNRPATQWYYRNGYFIRRY